MSKLGNPTYERSSPERREFKRFDDLAQWWWGDDAFDPELDFLSFPTGSAALELKLKSLAGAERFPHLKGLHLGDVRLSNLKGIAGFEGLESLTIHGNNVRKLDPLSELGSLRYLGLSLVGSSDFSPLSGLRSLEWLVLDESPIKDVSPLAAIENLRVLRLHYCRKVRDISPLSELELRHLDLSLCELKKAEFRGFQSLCYLKPNDHYKVVDAATTQLNPDVVWNETRSDTLANLLVGQGWVRQGDEARLPACAFELHGQRPVGTGDLSSFRNLRELDVPWMAGLDLGELGALRRVVAGYSSDLVLPRRTRFGIIGSAAAPTGKWVNLGDPGAYDEAHYPELKWWLHYDAAWRISD